ncbi:thioester reductase domain-containing protein [Neorhodopirellula lusitana]|uniref:Thioester reductase domain-containing protein n=1 Tax=Neorhodopirellula lusitana TaxID=445327 RepID=A0ABY1QD08_9BACT|nr:type I polyketide synthase [Neorhodopirellula lusitana]SMP66153.1 thioester reductase domain-containing protein [Neorhodopirellula lusitana]
MAQEESEPLSQPSGDSVAIVGIGCRLPGGIHDVEALWDLLISGQDALQDVPADRWDLDRFHHADAAAKGRVLSRRGGFVSQLKEFDAGFWGISPREAARMDPQQRWLLETAWEAIEDAGIAPSRLRGEQVGVYVGASSHDYGTLQLDAPELIDVHTNTGATSSILSNRISYLLDLCGPSLTVDTACSSALVAIAMAVESIRAGRCSAALAGGVNALLLPNASIGFSKASMLSPTGACFAFDDRGDGYVRSEGAGLMLLKPLATAIEDGDPIYAVIRGCGVNQDGHTSSMTVPSSAGQASMLREAYRDAGVNPADVSYVEAHGTGTPVGDPIETAALGEVFREGRPDDEPLLIGSIKTNLGHLESASGIAGMIKAALVLQRGQIPANAHFKSVNANIPLAEHRLQIVDENAPIRVSGEQATAETRPIVGVNSFGFGGTNAHVVLQAIAIPEGKEKLRGVDADPLENKGNEAGGQLAVSNTRRPLLLPLSARDASALRLTAKAYRRALSDVAGAKVAGAKVASELRDFCTSAAERREQHSERMVVIGEDAMQLKSRITDWLAASESASSSSVAPELSGIVVSRSSADISESPTPALEHQINGPVMVFTGQGSQWMGMGRDLMEAEPIVRDTIEEIDDLFQPLSGWSLMAAMHDDSDGRIDETSVAQPAIFAIQVALVRLWRSWGVVPACVVGHSVGEVAAAWAAGVYDLASAVRLVYHRSRLQATTSGRGRMAAVGVSLEEAQRRIAGYEGQVAVTAVNSPSLVTIGGDTSAMEEIVTELAGDDLFVRSLKLDYAFHTHQMDVIESDLRLALQDLTPARSSIPMISSVTGTIQDTAEMSAEYWWQNVRKPVQFADAIETAIEMGGQAFLEVGPHPAMRSSLESILDASERIEAESTSVLHSIARDHDASTSLAVNLSRLHVDRVIEKSGDGNTATADASPNNAGVSKLNWRAINQSHGQYVRQPSYAWNHKPHWLDSAKRLTNRTRPDHPLLWTRMATAKPTWQTTLDPATLIYLKDHQVWDGILFPASGYAEIGLAVAATLYPDQRFRVEDIELLAALFVPSDLITQLQVVMEEGRRQVEIYSSTDSVNWELHGRCRLVPNPVNSQPETQDLHALKQCCDSPVDHESLYQMLRAKGYGFGEHFSLIQQLWHAEEYSIAEIAVPESLRQLADRSDGTQFHPAVLDACFQAALRPTGGGDPGAQRDGSTDDGQFYLPESIGRVRLWGDVDVAKLFAIAKNWTFENDLIRCDIDVTDDAGRPLADIRGFCVKATPNTEERNGAVGTGLSNSASGNGTSGGINEDLLLTVGWKERRLPGTRVEGSCGFPSSQHWLESLSPSQADARRARRLDEYLGNTIPAMRSLIVGSIQTAWIQLGWGSRFGWRVGERFTTSDLLSTNVFVDEYHDLVASQLHDLADAGCLQRSDARDAADANPTWTVVRELQSMDVLERLAELADAFPDASPDIQLLHATMPAMADILSGRVSAIERMFPGGSNATLTRFYTDSPDLAAYRELVAATVDQLIDGLPERRVLRVLEVGGGTGAMTDAVLESIEKASVRIEESGDSGKSAPVEYLFTDVSPAFVSAARTRIRSEVDVRFAVFDIEQEPKGQSIQESGFDLVIAANVLHATRDLRQTIGNLRRCLADDGALLVHEITEQDAANDNVFGLLSGWWRFDDYDLRPRSPILGQAAWKQLLEENGFSDVGVLSNTNEAGRSDLSVLLAQRTSDLEAEPAVDPVDEKTSDVASELVDASAVVNVLLADCGGMVERMADRIRDDGRTAVVLKRGDEFGREDEFTFTVAEGSREEFKNVLASLAINPASECVFVHGWSLDSVVSSEASSATTNDPTGMVSDLLEAQRWGVATGRTMIQAIDDLDLIARSSIYFVTRDGRSVTTSDRVSGLAASSITGFSGVIKNEMPLRGLTTIDLPAATVAESGEPFRELIDDLVCEIKLCQNERDVAYRDGRRFVSRLQRLPLSQLKPRVQEVVNSRPAYRLQTRRPGVLENLSWNETRRGELGPGDVEVRVMAGGINFRDVMKALAIYPGNPPDRLWFGDDIAGVVERVGSAVKDLAAGDRVVGIAPWAFRSHVITDRRLVMRCPNGVSMTEAATLPTVFLTAQFALDHLARMRSGESVLIHAAAGGVGQAAIQVAAHLGLEVYATAGSPAKRDLLLELGVRHVMDSRTYEFADQMMELTGGRGVDAVLNSLAGEFIPKSLSVLAPFGRFLEIGKADIYGNSPLGLAALKNNLSFHVIDLSQCIVDRPDSVAGLLTDLNARLDAGHYRPLTHQVFPAAEVVDAFRMMAKGEHIGKNVLAIGDELASDCAQEFGGDRVGGSNTPLQVGRCTEDGHLFSGDGTFLVTGGAGGFGFETAKWLARQGVRSLVLMSRSGPDETTAVEIDRMRQDGIEVVDARGDVTQRQDVATVIESIQASACPLRGVVHAAMVIDDDFVTEMDTERFDRVLHPKLIGAWNLHELTQGIPLEHFMLFSSVSTLMGAVRQSHYNAGNEFLNTLAQHRRAAGLPALSVNWSAIDGAGFVHRNQATAEFLKNTGFPTLNLGDAFRALGELVLHQTDVVGVAGIDWSQVGRSGQIKVAGPYFDDIRRGDCDARGGGNLQKRLLKASSEQRPEIMRQFLLEQVAGVFGIASGEIDTDVSLIRLGLDSLMAVELVNRIESEFASKVPMSRLLSGPSINQLTELFLASMTGADQDGGEATSADSLSESTLSTSDFTADAQLDEDIEFGNPWSDDRLTALFPTNAFLTGATGFLGAHLLSELLLQTKGRVTCLVRAEDLGSAKQRIVSNLGRYGLAADEVADRVDIVLGDLASPFLGLSPERFDELAGCVDVVYHNGADVNLLQPYEALRATNVCGTQEVLRLACQGSIKPVHFVSTYTVHATSERREIVVSESEPLPACEDLFYGYSQTKWVGESLMAEARRRGVPVTIYRPGHITGDSRTGIGNEDDLFHAAILMCVQLGAAPMNDVELDATPVDFVSRSIVSLSQRRESLGGTYHLTNPVPFQTSVLRDWLLQSELAVEIMTPSDWHGRLVQWGESLGGDDTGAGLMAEMLKFGSELSGQAEAADLEPVASPEQAGGLVQRLDCTQTTAELSSLGIVCPPADLGLLQLGASRLQGLGLIQRTDGVAKSVGKPSLNRTLSSSESL